MEDENLSKRSKTHQKKKEHKKHKHQHKSKSSKHRDEAARSSKPKHKKRKRENGEVETEKLGKTVTSDQNVAYIDDGPAAPKQMRLDDSSLQVKHPALFKCVLDCLENFMWGHEFLCTIFLITHFKFT